MTCGIDFGTSNSALGVVAASGVRLLPVEGAHLGLPTVLFFHEGGQGTTFGRRAMADYTSGCDGRFMRSIKSILGTTLAEEKTVVNGRPLAFNAVIATFLRHLRLRYAEALQHETDTVVLGRPVAFVDGDATADALAESQLEAAARLAGFKHIAFQFEPIAAAFDYEQQASAEELVLIADIGAGTSDFSVVRVGAGRAAASDRRGDILATGGVHIAGNDIDRNLSLAAVMPAFGYGSHTKERGLVFPVSYFHELATWHKIHFLYTNRIRADIAAMHYDAAEPEKLARFLRVIDDRAGHAISFAVEQGKIALSDAEQVAIDLTFAEAALYLPATRVQLEEANRGHISSISKALLETVGRAGVGAEKIRSLVFTGGGAQMPLLRRALQAALPAARVHANDAFSSVTTGLTLDAKRKFGELNV